ncbi:hypothetical protein L210DRAFT_3504648 [Boletus edulis BED1]|uniref:Uncharacterized protein n=1 Tax=Boletus edulis BED1 TaxID=1328754 RepID=A0AAD4BTF7_BOLED|nr:hypothetical protein L210DRAFT_3504648 [Boletus edulis BED1]
MFLVKTFPFCKDSSQIVWRSDGDIRLTSRVVVYATCQWRNKALGMPYRYVQERMKASVQVPSEMGVFLMERPDKGKNDDICACGGREPNLHVWKRAQPEIGARSCVLGNSQGGAHAATHSDIYEGFCSYR